MIERTTRTVIARDLPSELAELESDDWTIRSKTPYWHYGASPERVWRIECERTRTEGSAATHR